jgi:hypothetical protein
MSMDHLKTKIRHVPDFPKAGILFYDITTLLNDPQGFKDMIAALSAPYANAGVEQVVGIESRGFILGAAVATQLGAGFVPIRKPGKLPSKTHREDYALEYGTDCLEIHQDAVRDGRDRTSRVRPGPPRRGTADRLVVPDRVEFPERPREAARRGGVFRTTVLRRGERRPMNVRACSSVG